MLVCRRKGGQNVTDRQGHRFFNTHFFVDDGFSGVSFEREGLQAMLHKIEAGNVATVITKDLSRLGRNHLKTGELIEIVFPEYEVIYISINDGVDTAREDNEFTPLRNWFNEFYARDTSKKIRAVKIHPGIVIILPDGMDPDILPGF